MPEAPLTTHSLSLPIEGMTCASCVGRVERALGAVPGVASARVNLATGRAEVSGTADLAALADAVQQAGYGIGTERHRFRIGGMTCASCAGRIERALRAVPGVLEAQVNLAGETAEVSALAGTGEAALAAAIVAAGYQVIAAKAEEGAEAVALRRERRDLVLAGILTAPFLLGMLGMAFGRDWMPGGWVQLALATPVQFWLGARFFRAGWAALKARTGNMDLLVALGTTAAWVLSVWMLLTADPHHGAPHLYFEAGAVVVFFVLVGRYLEARAKRATGAAIRALLELRPRSARRLRGGVEEEEVPSAALAVGDVVVVRPGERIPVDGTVREGEAAVDESALTGESRPIEKVQGTKVSTGTVALDGRLVIAAEAVGEQTVLARVAALVAAAQASRAPVQKLVDRVSAVFVPVVIGIALLAFVVSLALGLGVETAVMRAVTVLVIACPCALGLATPAAIMAGTGAAARAGILIRDAEVIERAGAITRVAFDKTGTLTEGRPRLAALHRAEGASEGEALRLAAALQSESEHPLARAVLAAWHARGLGAVPQPAEFRALPGRGVSGAVEGRRLRLGSARLREESGADAGGLDTAAAHEAAQGRTLSWLIEERAGAAHILALLAFEDAPRPGAAEAVAALRAMGVSVAMLSGDSRAAASAAAARLGVDEVAAEVLPEDKARQVAAWQAEGHRVAMVGDGVNDAPALAAADLGIAMGSGTDAAIEAAGLTLLRPDPRLVPAALAIAKRTHGKIRQNLAWAFGYNALGLPFAAFGLLSPAIAGAMMALSSVSVLLSALLLARWRPEGLSS